jgi:hypothetical protein
MAFQFPKGFTEHHEELMGICFGNSNAKPRDVEKLNDQTLDHRDLARMIHMVKVEFAASLDKEMKGLGGENAIQHQGGAGKVEKDSVPHVYDVFLMETTLEHRLERREHRLAVCFPERKKNEGGKNKLIWFNGRDVWPIDPPTHKWRVASLSGAARILEALHNPTNLTFAAMNGQHIIRSILDEDDFSSRRTSEEERDRRSSAASLSHTSPLAGLAPWALDTLTKEADIQRLQRVFNSVDDDSRRDDSDSTIDWRTKVDLVTQQLNDSQRRAVQTIADPTFREGFFVVQGPPGTGEFQSVSVYLF